jgi:predicted permease
MSGVRWIRAMLRRLAPERAEDVLGDLEEMHQRWLERHGRAIASVLTALEALDIALALIRERIRRRILPGDGGSSITTGRVPGMSWLDAKLGARMLVKHPGLSLAGGLGITVAVAIATMFFTVIHSVTHPTLPLPEGDRIVALQNFNLTTRNPNRQVLHDFVMWQDELKSVQELGAFYTTVRNLITPDGNAEQVRLAAMTALGFRVARVAPVLGRPLIEQDEQPGSPPVVVIGYDVWQKRFAGARDIIGRTFKLGTVAHTVVGVMPAGFAFPENFHFWIPLQLNASNYQRGEGPGLQVVFGRLAPGVTMEAARAELTTIGRRMSAAFPETHRHLRPRILPYTGEFIELDSPAVAWLLRLVQFVIILLLVLVSTNVAILVYARTATRMGEIAIRSALGASRRRVVLQLFVEALLLSAPAAVFGLLLAVLTLDRAVPLTAERMAGGLPFWFDFRPSPATLLYVAALAVLAALIAGVVPALKATGRRVRNSLQLLAGGGSAVQLGRTWTVLIVAQIAVAAAILPATLWIARSSIDFARARPDPIVEQFLTARLWMDRDWTAVPATEREAFQREFASQFEASSAELLRRLRAEPRVSKATYTTNRPPGPSGWVEIETAPTDSNRTVQSGPGGHLVGVIGVSPDYFDAIDVSVSSGRNFRPEDQAAASSAVIVNRAFAQQLFGAGNPLGRRVRYVRYGGDDDNDGIRLDHWYEIVGVVDGSDPSYQPGGTLVYTGLTRPRLYHPTPRNIYPVMLTVRVRGSEAASFPRQLRAVAASVDPTLQLSNVQTLGQVLLDGQGLVRLLAVGLALANLSVLLLSAAGIYALMSFAVTQRRREIGIRAALGAQPRRILATVLSRALGQLATGVLIGLAIAGILDLVMDGDLMGGHAEVMLPLVVLLMFGIGSLAAIGPARRGFRIQPTEALKADG